MNKTPFRCHNADACALGQKTCPTSGICGITQEKDEMKTPIKMTPGDDMHLTFLMAPQSLNLAVGQLREQLLGYGRAAFEAGKAGQCLHQIQEPDAAEQAAWFAGLDEGRAQAAPAAVAVPDAVRDALLQSEAALEVATARILKADPDHSISVTSEAKALVAVRAALAATPAATAQARGGELNQFLSAAKDAGITHLPMSFGEALRELEAATGTVVLPESDEQVKELMVLIGKYGSAVEANSTGNPSNYTLASDESAAYEAIKAKLRALLATGGKAQAVEVDDSMALAFHHAITDGAIGQDDLNEIKIGLRAALVNLHAPQAQDVGRGEVLVTVSGFTGSGKSAIAGEIEILCRALGLQVDWPGGDSEKNMTHADWTAALEQYKPRVRIVEHNVPTSESKNDH